MPNLTVPQLRPSHLDIVALDLYIVIQPHLLKVSQFSEAVALLLETLTPATTNVMLATSAGLGKSKDTMVTGNLKDLTVTESSKATTVVMPHSAETTRCGLRADH
ncbi:hypothetical protein NC652_022603 [Populus alba x Populus x berolinensis]|nr:hypothetical protein NC652_022603 [Populus alba x Populus x berolinensis]